MRLELIHPMIVHFPIVFILSLFALDAFGLLRGWPLSRGTKAGDASFTLAAAAGIFALAAFFFGDMALDVAMEAGTAPAALLEPHEEIGSTMAIALAGWALVRAFLWWRHLELGRALATSVVLVEGILVVGVLVAALYGGELVYEHGVAVMAAAQ